MNTFLILILAATTATQAAPTFSGFHLSTTLKCVAGSSHDQMLLEFETYNACLRCNQARLETQLTLSAPLITRLSGVSHIYRMDNPPLGSHSLKHFTSHQQLHPWFSKKLSVVYFKQIPTQLIFNQQKWQISCEPEQKKIM